MVDMGEEMNNNVEVFYCKDQRRYFIIDEFLNKNSIYNKYIRIHRVTISRGSCKHDTSIKKNLTELEAQNLCLILDKLNPKK